MHVAVVGWRNARKLGNHVYDAERSTNLEHCSVCLLHSAVGWCAVCGRAVITGCDGCVPRDGALAAVCPTVAEAHCPVPAVIKVVSCLSPASEKACKNKPGALADLGTWYRGKPHLGSSRLRRSIDSVLKVVELSLNLCFVPTDFAIAA
jgi:hypothetical protein